MKLIIKRPTKAKSSSVPTRTNRKVFRMFKRLDNGDFLIAGWVPKFRRASIDQETQKEPPHGTRN